MAHTVPIRRTYDYRIREFVCQTGDTKVLRHLGIPRSTAATWIARGCPSVVSIDDHYDLAAVLAENENLKRRARRQLAIIRLLVVLLRLSS